MQIARYEEVYSWSVKPSQIYESQYFYVKITMPGLKPDFFFNIMSIFLDVFLPQCLGES